MFLSRLTLKTEIKWVLALAELGCFLVNWNSPSCFCCTWKWAEQCESCCGAKLAGGCLHLAQTPAHPSSHWSGAASLFISPRQEIPPHTGFAPWVISWDRDSSHPSGDDMAFRNGLRVPKPTHSASQQENSVTGLVASKPCLGLFPLRWEQWGAAGWF